MTAVLATSLVGLFGSIILAALTYWATKRREREAEWRKEKLGYYKDFIESMSGIVEGDDSPEGHKLFARATNNLLLFAPQSVIEALNAFRSEIAISNQNRSPERHDKLLAQLLPAMRRDVGVSPVDDPTTFKPMIWASEARKNAI